MKKFLFLLSLLILISCTSYELKVGEVRQFPDGTKTRISENFYKIKDNVSIEEYVFGDANLKLSSYYKAALRLHKYTDGKILFSVPYYYFYESRFFRGVLISNGEEMLEIFIDNISRVDGVPNIYLNKKEVNKLNNILKSNLKITARVRTEKETINLYFTEENKNEFLRVLNYIF
ncbi:MAG: hypothetical protein ACRC6U_06365 [Fusobacteriaceae bacterium]